MEIDCDYFFKENGKCIVSLVLGNPNDHYFPRNFKNLKFSKNPKEKKSVDFLELLRKLDLLNCIRPEDPKHCPQLEYFEIHKFEESRGTKSLGNFLKRCGYC